ncbi:MAG: hypothetical protein ACK42G_08090, partial [Candidatus Kapaibacteriota bacterium]
MNRLGLYIFFIIVLIPIMVLSEWKDISIRNRKEKIYSVDVKNKDLNIKESDFEKLTDSIVAVGWSSTNGALFISNDGGRNWEVHEIQAFFPFAVEFLDNGNLFVCGYNYITDNAEVNIFDLNGRQLESYAFDGENLPYLKNLFDCTVDSFKVLTTGYQGSVLLFDKEEHKWEQILVDPSKVFIKIKKFTFNTSQGVLTVGFLLGGKSFLLPEAIYFSNSPYKDWQMLYDFGRAYKGIEVIDFWFYDWDIENNFPFGFVIGLIDDTLAVFEANPNEQNFTKIYFEQTTSQPLGMYCFEINKTIIVPFDNGKLLKSENFGQTWHYVENNANKQLLAVKFFKYWSESLLPEIFWNNVIILGFGSDGFITKYDMDLSLQVETSFPKRECDFDEICVFDLLGREIGMFDRQNLDRWLNLQNSIDGIYLVVKFVNGI